MASLRARLSGIQRHQWLFGIFSVAVTLTVIVGFLVENRWGYMKPSPTLIYVSSWNEGRTREEAKVAQAEDVAARTRAYYAQQAEFARGDAIVKAREAKARAE